MKKIISVVLALVLICSACAAYADTWKTDTGYCAVCGEMAYVSGGKLAGTIGKMEGQ